MGRIFATLFVIVSWGCWLFILWQLWAITGSLFDYVFPGADRDSFWRFLVQIISVPIFALLSHFLISGISGLFRRRD